MSDLLKGIGLIRFANAIRPTKRAAPCSMICRRGPRYISNRGAGWRRTQKNRRWPLSTVARCAQPPESASRAGYDGAKRKRRLKLHMAVDTLRHLLALYVTPANVGDRAEPRLSHPPENLVRRFADLSGRATAVLGVDDDAGRRAAGGWGIIVRIPTQSGRGFRFDAGQRSEMKPATIPN